MKLYTEFIRGQKVWYCANDETGEFIEATVTHIEIKMMNNTKIYYGLTWNDGRAFYFAEENDLVSQQLEHKNLNS